MNSAKKITDPDTTMAAASPALGSDQSTYQPPIVKISPA